MRKELAVLCMVCFSLQAAGQAVTAELNGQAAGWGMVNLQKPFYYQFGARTLPALSITGSLDSLHRFDAEVSGNFYTSATFTGNVYQDGVAGIRPYRVWVRYSTPGLELRLGLQKINFGSASILRPLMWFDQVDPRDPLQITDGVYALLGRYYFGNNAGIWLWGIYGNGKTKGWEYLPTKEKTAEAGGRLQLLAGPGEVAFTCHRRLADCSQWTYDSVPVTRSFVHENRFAIDGKWDLGIGISGEIVVKKTGRFSPLVPEWEKYMNIGMDYTFAVGNGLGLVLEHLLIQTSGHLFASSGNTSFTALTLSYPLGVLDRVAGIFFYDWSHKSFYRFISFNRQYDKWSLYWMAFWNPQSFTIFHSETRHNLMAGKGIQFMVVYNF
jgi:hypothetical protein